MEFSREGRQNKQMNMQDGDDRDGGRKARTEQEVRARVLLTVSREGGRGWADMKRRRGHERSPAGFRKHRAELCVRGEAEDNMKWLASYKDPSGCCPEERVRAGEGQGAWLGAVQHSRQEWGRWAEIGERSGVEKWGIQDTVNQRVKAAERAGRQLGGRWFLRY